MFRDFFDALKIELMGVIPEVRIGAPREDKEGKLNELTVYLSFVNIENVDRQRGVAVIRVLITAFEPNKDNADEKEKYELAAIEAIDEIFSYLEENKKSYHLVATPENLTNNIWSAFRIPLRPFLVYECPVRLSNA